jgi:hypothetical protein
VNSAIASGAVAMTFSISSGFPVASNPAIAAAALDCSLAMLISLIAFFCSSLNLLFSSILCYALAMFAGAPVSPSFS